MADNKTIPHDTYLKALGLFHLAVQHRQKCDEFDRALANLLEVDTGGHLSDAIYQVERGDSLDAALERINLTVEESP